MSDPSSATSAGNRLLLLIEDDAPLRRSLQLLLQGQGFEVRAYASGVQALADSSAAHADSVGFMAVLEKPLRQHQLIAALAGRLAS